MGGVMVSTIIRDASTLDGRRVDVVLDGELVADGQPTEFSADDVIDARDGLLCLFIDTHVHLDKVLIRNRLPEHDGTLRGAIDSIHAAKRHYTVDEVRERAVEVIRSSVLTGTTRLRSTSTSTPSAASPRCMAYAPQHRSAAASPTCRRCFPAGGHRA